MKAADDGAHVLLLQEAHLAEHMDIRPANVIARQGHPLALVDWDNALLGPAALELARIAEYGHLNEEFMRGYKRIWECAPVSKAGETVYRMDTAVMLAVVFVSEAPDPVRGRWQLEHALSLSKQLRQQW